MTKEEFIKQYCEGSFLDPNKFHLKFFALPCECGAINCKGWATIARDPIAVFNHTSLYMPNDGELTLCHEDQEVFYSLLEEGKKLLGSEQRRTC